MKCKVLYARKWKDDYYEKVSNQLVPIAVIVEKREQKDEAWRFLDKNNHGAPIIIAYKDRNKWYVDNDHINIDAMKYEGGHEEYSKRLKLLNKLRHGIEDFINSYIYQTTGKTDTDKRLWTNLYNKHVPETILIPVIITIHNAYKKAFEKYETIPIIKDFCIKELDI